MMPLWNDDDMLLDGVDDDMPGDDCRHRDDGYGDEDDDSLEFVVCKQMETYCKIVVRKSEYCLLTLSLD